MEISLSYTFSSSREAEDQLNGRGCCDISQGCRYQGGKKRQPLVVYLLIHSTQWGNDVCKG